MHTSLKKLATVGVLALGMGLSSAWADMTKEEIIAKIEAGMSKAQQQNHDQWVAAAEALLKSGVAPEKCVELVKSAMTREVSAHEVAEFAKQAETRAPGGDRAAAEKYAAEGFARFKPQAKSMRDEITSPTRGGHAGSGSGYGGYDWSGHVPAGGGAGSGSGMGNGYRP